MLWVNLLEFHAITIMVYLMDVPEPPRFKGLPGGWWAPTPSQLCPQCQPLGVELGTMPGWAAQVQKCLGAKGPKEGYVNHENSQKWNMFF